MIVSMIKDDKLMNTTLPNKIEGNYWITDYDYNNIEFNLINIEAKENKWFLHSNEDYVVYEKDIIREGTYLENYHFYTIGKIHSKNKKDRIYIYCSPENDATNTFIDIREVPILSIGSKDSNMISYNSLSVNGEHAVLKFENGRYFIQDLDSNNGVFVNNKRIKGMYNLEFGDILFIMGLKIIVMKDEEGPYIIVNNPLNSVTFHSMRLITKSFNQKESKREWLIEETYDVSLYESKDYFYSSPHFKSNLISRKIVIDAPPNEEKVDETPMIYVVGPMLTMGMTSCVTSLVTLNSVMNEGRSLTSAMPSLVICGAMLMSMVFWPILNRRYEKKKKKKREAKRQEKYGKYIEQKRIEIQREVEVQTNIAKNNHISLKECEAIVLNRKRNLWERHIGDEDFLSVSLGIGNTKAKIEIQYPEEHFSMDEDNLKEMVYSLGSEPKELLGVPILTSFATTKATAIIGDFSLVKLFMDGIFLQLFTFHSYDELKVMMVTNQNHESEWEYLKSAPHLFNNDKSVRYFGTNQMEIKELMYELEKVYQSRVSIEGKKAKIKTHYLIITDYFRLLRTFDTVKHILEDETENLGISFIILNQDLSAIPSECSHIIHVAENNSFMIEKILNSNNNVAFRLDLNPYIQKDAYIRILANTPLELDLSNGENIPTKYGFLEMYDVGKIEQLNIINRWIKNSPIHSLQVPIGIGASGDIITLDLHEKYHGPHGLIAGTTGSGKSEFIITYILSLAVNFHPEEVQFILIDYKGGGLALAFVNNETGVRLPHLSGTITNLDTNEINRSLASIESELKRRQRMFNEAREKSNDSTMDIYKYQKLYREKKVSEPIAHLFIICDEFAELKTQQSDFMQQLISTARVGRSLGVHLILATQKPSGVVDSQIWSNTRFRVCLKVQEKSDSSEVIKCPDAAYLKDTGRFYLQVGYNEIFQLGQAAYAGGVYIPSEKRKKSIDTSLNFIDNVGRTIKSIDYEVEPVVSTAKGEELSNIVSYLSALAQNQKISIRKLWLDKIPSFLLLDHLKEKYKKEEEAFIINPIVGEYDLPAKQMQMPLTLPISKEGNVCIYGFSGSGKENFLTTFIYSLMQEKTSREINIYILDFGSGALRSFKDAKIVGDYVTSSDEEKVANLFKMLNQEMENRKIKFQEYSGDFKTYIKNSGETLPNIIIIINSYEVYEDMYNSYEEKLNDLTRDGVKYGIYFVFTSSTVNGLKLKLKQNINQIFVLQQTNESDYSTLLGNVKKKYPSKTFGRGIVKLDDIYEFQTAFVCEKDNISSFIKSKSNEIIGEKVRPIPVLPNIINRKMIESYKREGLVVVGVEKNTLEISMYDYMKSTCDLITMQDIEICPKFVVPFLEQLQSTHVTLYVLNAENLKLGNTISNIYTSKFDEFITTFSNAFKNQLTAYQNKNLKGRFAPVLIVIIGFESLREQLSDESKAKLNSFFLDGKKLGIYQFILVEAISKIKKVELEPWYKETVNNTNAIWLGSGIADQYTIKLSKTPKELKEEIPQNFCYVVKKGIATLVKFVEEYNEK